MKPEVVRIWDFPASAIQVLILLTAAQRLYATNWAASAEIIPLQILLGVSLGLCLGLSRYKKFGILWLSFGYSISVLPLLAAAIFYHETPWLERMLSLAGRLGYSIQLYASSHPVPDTALLVLSTAASFWFISLLAGFAFSRHGRVAATIVPAGIALFVIQLSDSHVGDHMLILAIFSALCLLLLGRTTFVRKRITWKEQHVTFSTEAWNDLNISLPAAALILVFMAWMAPVTGRPIVSAKVWWERITRPLEETRKNLGNVSAGVRTEQIKTTEFYGNSLVMGQNASAGDFLALRIRVPMTVKSDRYYWRVRTYDQYINDAWRNADTYDEPFIPDQHPIPIVDAQGESGVFFFTAPRSNLAALVTPAHPVWTSRPSILSFTPTIENQIDPLMFHADPPILIGEEYSVHANVFNPTAKQLLNAGTTYPGWVQEHYLQIPEELAPQLTDLARQITAEAATPYDKALSVTHYLRTNITYSTTVPAPPTDMDPLSWVLFDLRKGFCTYYATAEVLLLRSVGVPARLVAGFAQGEFEAPDKFNVLGRDAHAWPEVYFPGLGWVEFEPTSSQPPLIRRSEDTQIIEAPANPQPDEPLPGVENRRPLPEEEGADSGHRSRLSSSQRLMLVLGIMILLVMGLGLAFMFGLLDKTLERARRILQTPFPILLHNAHTSLALTPPIWLDHWVYTYNLKPIERSFSMIYRSLRWVGLNTTLAQTPAEAGAALIDKLPAAANDIHALLREYEYAQYSQKAGDLKIARIAEEVIRRQALRVAIRLRVNRLRGLITRLFKSRSNQNGFASQLQTQNDHDQ